MAENSIYVPRRSDEEIEALALEYLSLAQMQNDMLVDVLRLVNVLSTMPDLPTSGLEIQRMPAKEMSKHRAYATSKPPRICVSDAYFNVSLFETPDLREMIAHELGHVIMHPGLAKALSVEAVPPRKHLLVRPENDSERQAIKYSEALLMPRRVVAKFNSPEDLAVEAMVPLQRATDRYNWVLQTSAKIIPLSVRREIELLRPTETVDEKLRRNLWEFCDKLPDDDPNVWRLAGRWPIRWDKYQKSVLGGWRIVNKKIVSWEDESTR